MLGLHGGSHINKRFVNIFEFLLAFLFPELLLFTRIIPLFHFFELDFQFRACGSSSYFFDSLLQFCNVLSSIEKAFNGLIYNKMKKKLSMSGDEVGAGIVKLF